MNDPVNHPAHYTNGPKCEHCGKTVECIVVAENMSFSVGNCVKYLWRAGLKAKDPTEDLKKAAWYIQREIARLEKNK